MKLGGKIAEEFGDVQENEKYIIESTKEVLVEDAKQNKEYPSIKVTMKSVNPKDTAVYNVTLWLTETPTPSSLLGSFLVAFEEFFKGEKNAWETDNWLGHTVLIKTWKYKKRLIEVTA